MSTGLKQRLKPALKKAAITAGLEASALLQRLGIEAAGDGLIFTLHHVRPASPLPFQPNRHLDITPEFLDTALTTLAGMGYDFISLDEAASRLGHSSGRSRFACFTLDDGFRDNAVHAAPVFDRHRAPFTIFIAKGFSEATHSAWWETLGALLNRVDSLRVDLGGGPVSLPARTRDEKSAAFDRFARFINEGDEATGVCLLDATARENGLDPLALIRDLVMTSAELQSLAENPLANYGAHTVSHRGLARLDEAESRREIEESADYVQALLGRRPAWFAYPYGDQRSVSMREQETLRALELRAVTTRPATLQAGGREDLTALPRISLNGLYQKSRYVKALASGLPFKIMG